MAYSVRPTGETSFEVPAGPVNRGPSAVVGVVAGLLLVAVVMAVMLTRPTAEQAKLLGEASSNQTRSVKPWPRDDVLIVDDGYDQLTILDPTDAVVMQQTSHGQLPGDQPHRVIQSADRLIVGWGQITATNLGGEFVRSLGDATYTVPAVESGAVWLIEYSGGAIGSEQGTARLVDVDDGSVWLEGSLPKGGNVYAGHGIAGGLVLESDAGIVLWDAASGLPTFVGAPGPGFVGDASPTKVAWCYEPCTGIELTTADGNSSTVDMPDGQSMQPRSARFSPDGRYVAALAEANPGAERPVTGVLIADVQRGKTKVVPVRRVEQGALLEWSSASDSVYLVSQSGHTSLDIRQIDPVNGDDIQTQVPHGGDGMGDLVVVDRQDVLGLADLAGQIPVCDAAPDETPCRYVDDGSGGQPSPGSPQTAGERDGPEPGSAEPGSAEPGSAEPGSAEPGSAEQTGSAMAGTDASPRTRDPVWRDLPASPLSARLGPVSVWSGEEFLVWGGYAGGGTPDEAAVADGAAYDPAANTWRQIADAPIPGSYGAQAFWTGQEMWVLGGWGGVAGHDDMVGAAAYNPATDVWRTLPDVPRPVVAASWIHGVAVVMARDGPAYVMTPDTTVWQPVGRATDAEWRDDRRIAGINPPFQVASGPSALLIVDPDQAQTVVGARSAGLFVKDLPDDLGLDPTAMDQRIDIISDVDARTTTVVGPAGTLVVDLDGGSRILEPPPFRFVDLVDAGDGQIVAVEQGTGFVAVLDNERDVWTSRDLPSEGGLHSRAVAAGDGMIFLWGGADFYNVPEGEGALLSLQD